MKNRLSRRAKITEKQLRELIYFFSMDLTVKQIAMQLEINRNTASRYVTALRKRIAEAESGYHLIQIANHNTQVESTQHISGKNPSEKNILVLVFEHQGEVSTQLVPQHSIAQLQAIMRGQVHADGVLEALALQDCKAIGNLGEKYLFHILPYTDQDKNVEKLLIGSPPARFWTSLNERVRKFRGIQRDSMFLHIKESEFRFNNRDTIEQKILGLLAEKPLFSADQEPSTRRLTFTKPATTIS